MNKTTVAQQAKTASFSPPAHGILQRKCACGNHTIAGGECAECTKKKSGLQRKVTIGASNDPLEQEADRVADQVMTVPGHATVSGAPPRIHRYAEQATEVVGTAPASVDRILVSSGRPLEPALRQDMGQRFCYDFSRVRVHSGATAEQSAREVNANAYTVGHNIVFGAGRFASGTHEGRRLIAHELTHVVQQTGADRMLGRQGNQTHGLSSIAVMRQQEGNASEQQSPGFWGTIGGGLMGEFNEDPNFAMIGVDLGVSLVPILDQASDARDIIAHLYFMTVKKQFDRFMRWIGLVFSLIGLFPEIGSVIKGASKFIIKGVREVLTHLGELLRPLRRILPEIADVGRFQAYITRNWSRFVAFGTRAWNKALNRVTRLVSAASTFVGRLVKPIRDALARIREIAPSKLASAFSWVKRQFNNVLDQVMERLGLRSRRVDTEISEAVERDFAEHLPAGGSAQPHATTPQLARGNLGERLAAEALASDGHHILSYKPSILGTNQGGIDIVTIRNGVVHLIDNKALSRSGNVASVSALTTNFAQNLATVRGELTTMLADASRSAGERQLIQQALNALNSGNFVRVVTNANVTRDTRILSGVTQQLQSQGIRFIDVFP